MMNTRVPIAALCIASSLLGGCSSLSSSQAHTKVSAAEQKVGYYIAPSSVDLDQLLPKPSPDRSPISKGEGDLMLAIRARATDADKARMKSEETLTPWAFADVVGPGFSKEKMPLTAAMLEKVEKDTNAATSKAKQLWDRRRPPRQDARISPLVHLPSSASYPSGHATRAVVWERILAELDPKDKDALRERARIVALDRVIAGVHYPTDVAAGMALGDAIADEFLASPAFKADLDRARAEWPPRT
jgi:hypothetical protein